MLLFLLLLFSLKKNFLGLVIAEKINCRATSNPNTIAMLIFATNSKIRDNMSGY